MPEPEFRALAHTARNLSDLLRKLGYPGNTGDTARALKQRLTLLGIEIVKKRYHGGGPKAVPLEDWLVEGCSAPRQHLKRKLLSSGKLENRCAICNCEPVWQGKPLVLRLDHANGVRDDNRPHNLRLVCPNCDSQLATFCGRNNRRKEVPSEVVETPSKCP